MKKFRKITSIMLSLSLIAIVFVGCSTNKDTVKDREGRDVNIPKKIEKIISTAPSNTEVLVELGLGDKIIAADKFSGDVKGVKQETPKLDFSNPDGEKIISLKPDIIIASSHNKTGSAADPFKAIEEAGIPVVYIPSSDSIQGRYDDISFIASITSTKEKGEKIISNMKKDIDDIKKKSESIKNKKKVYFEIGSTPNLYSFGSGTFLNEMIEIIGAENILKDEKSWVTPTDESIIKKNPDVILTNEGYIENATELIKKRKGWENVNGVKNSNVYLIDNNASSRPSQNVIKALKEMANAIYPEIYEK